MGLSPINNSVANTPIGTRDALQTLTGFNRLDAGAIKNLPAAGTPGATGATGAQGLPGTNGSGGGLYAWQIKTSNYTAVAGDRLRVDCTNGNVTILLPATPTDASVDIEIQRIDDTVNSLILDPNGKQFKTQTNKDGLFNNSNIGLSERISYPNNAIGWLPQHDRLTYQTHVNIGILDPLFANVVFLVLPNGSDNSTIFTDSSSYNRPITTVGDTKIISDTAVFDGTGDRLTIAASPTLAMGSSNFCFETEIETNQSTSFAAFLTRSSSGFGTGSWALLISPAGKLAIYFADFSTSAPILTSSTTINDGISRHFAWDRSGNNHRLFVNGILEQTVLTTVTMPDCLTPLAIGDDLNFGGRNYNGKNKAVRITNASRYIANFTPPTIYPTA